MRYLVREYEVGQVRFKYTRVTDDQTDEELRARLEDYKARLQESQRKHMRDITILEFTNSNQYSPQQRRIQGEWNCECARCSVRSSCQLSSSRFTADARCHHRRVPGSATAISV